MRDSLKEFIKDAITFEFNLPNTEREIIRSPYSKKNDACFDKKDDDSIASVIYNSIVEYAIGEYDINYDNLDSEFLRSLFNFKFCEDDSDDVKLKYGFYGEVLLYTLLLCKFKADVLISRGYLYNPLENSETKGYDAFHLIQRNGGVEFWFGEAKFYQRYTDAIRSVISNLKKALSDEYFNKNLLAIVREKDHLAADENLIRPLAEQWKRNPQIILSEELNKNGMSLIYPVLIVFQKSKRKSYDENIRDCIKYIQKLYDAGDLTITTSFSIRMFFIFLPVDDSKKIKESVLDWISLKKPLL